ncbi:transposase DNA-binding-containing protein [uncultured Nostoc sp.]
MAAKELSQADLGDVRRNKRLIRILVLKLFGVG